MSHRAPGGTVGLQRADDLLNQRGAGQVRHWRHQPENAAPVTAIEDIDDVPFVLDYGMGYLSLRPHGVLCEGRPAMHLGQEVRQQQTRGLRPDTAAARSAEVPYLCFHTVRDIRAVTGSISKRQPSQPLDLIVGELSDIGRRPSFGQNPCQLGSPFATREIGARQKICHLARAGSQPHIGQQLVALRVAPGDQVDHVPVDDASAESRGRTAGPDLCGEQHLAVGTDQVEVDDIKLVRFAGASATRSTRQAPKRSSSTAASTASTVRRY